MNDALAHHLKNRIHQRPEIIVNLAKASAAPREQVLGERRDVQPLRPGWRPSSQPGLGPIFARNQPAHPFNLFVPIEQLAKTIEQPGQANVLWPVLVRCRTNSLTRACPVNLRSTTTAERRDSPEHNAIWLENRRLMLEEASSPPPERSRRR